MIHRGQGLGYLVKEIQPDFQHRGLVILVDYDKTRYDNKMLDSIKNESAQMIKTTFGDEIPIQVSRVQYFDAACTSQTSECRPIIGGISVGQKNVNTLNTIGYKATRNGNLGFVIAGHTASVNGVTMVQAHNQNNNEVGIVEGRCKTVNLCDSAFVKVNSGIGVLNQIYRTPSSVYTITSKTPDSSQTVGTIVWKSGAASGLTTGEITFNGNGGTDHVTVKAYAQGGDSGSPALKITSGTNVSIYGALYSIVSVNGVIHFLYHAQDDIQNASGAIASTS